MTPNFTRSHALHARAKQLMPGGVNSPVRSGKAVGAEPVTLAKGAGAWVTDADGNTYVDYVLSWGPLVLGHAPAAVAAALKRQVDLGTSFGFPTELENTLAERVMRIMPNLERIRFVSSGTEAVMSALRLARAATKRDIIIKCSGCYHGHTDSLLVAAGSGAASLGVPSSPGVGAAVASGTVIVPYNDAAAVEAMFKAHPGKIAAMILEPVAGNMGLVLPQPGYLEKLRQLCDEHGALLIFDEVMCGFRIAVGGAFERYGVKADLTCLGKVIGGGLPCAAYGGRADLMHLIAPEGPVYQAGTLSGNPLAMVAGLATLDGLTAPGVQAQLTATAKRLADGLAAEAKKAGVPVSSCAIGSMLGLFFVAHEGDSVVRWENDAAKCRTDRYAAFWRTMRDEGVLLAPAQFESWFVSTEHGEKEIEHTLKAAAKGFAAAGGMA